MKTHFCYNRKFSLLKKSLLVVFVCLLLSCALFTACKKPMDYFAYVSELRSNILLAENEDFSLRVYALEKEYPYSSDGVKRDVSTRAEIRLHAPSGDKTCNISFVINGVTHGGEMSYDNVKAEYYYASSLDISTQKQMDFSIVYGEETLTFSAKSVLTENTLTPQTILTALTEKESELFQSLTDEYGFAGEIFIRLLYEDFPYYYVGVIDRNGSTTAFLINGETGEILAKRHG